MKSIVTGAVATTALMFTIGIASPAAATNEHIVGIEQTVGAPDGARVAYTVTKIVPSADPVAHPVAGRLYEASVMARALQGTVVPLTAFFNARTDSGTNYPAISNVSSLSAAPLGDGATTDGKVYFDVVGPLPTSVVYDNPAEGVLTWSEPIPGDPATGGSAGGSGGSTGGAGGSQGVMGSTGPNEAIPTTTGGDIGGGEGGTEGGGGNLSSGGGSGASSGDTGGNTGSGGGGIGGGVG